MCKFWLCKHRKTEDKEDDLKSPILVSTDKEDDLKSPILVSIAEEDSIKEVCRFSKIEYDRITNNRLNWGCGFGVEVFSKSGNMWFSGLIIKIMGEGQDRTVKVVYNGSVKKMSLWSSGLRPLLSDPTKRSQLSFNTILGKALTMLETHQPIPEPEVLNAFISHSQKDAQDAVGLLFQLLDARGVNAWVDMQQDTIDVAGMVNGITKSRCFIIYLTKSYFQQVFTIFELEVALLLAKPVLVVWEGDERHAGHSKFESYLEGCPDRYKNKLFQKEAVMFERRKHLQDAQINVLSERILKTASSKTLLAGAVLVGGSGKEVAASRDQSKGGE